jgi:sugar phosphate isomerase/epimerase
VTWQIGASTGCCADTPLEPVLDALAAVGIPGIEIGIPPRCFNPWRRDHVEAVRTKFAATGIAAVSVHEPFGGPLDLSDPNSHHRCAAIGAILDAALALRTLGGRIVIVHPSHAPRGIDAASRLSHCADALQRLQDACDAIQMTLAIETPLPHLVGGAPDEFAWLVDRVGENARVCMDTSHATLGRNWDAFMSAVGPRIVHVHANDHFGRRDDHVPPGDGVIDWAHVGASLFTLGYSGWLMLELSCPNVPIGPYFRRAADGLVRQLQAAEPVRGA